MTHVLDEAIDSVEHTIFLRWIFRHPIDFMGWQHDDEKRRARLDFMRQTRSYIAALRSLRAERAESRDDHVYRAVMAERERQQRLSAELVEAGHTLEGYEQQLQHERDEASREAEASAAARIRELEAENEELRQALEKAEYSEWNSLSEEEKDFRIRESMK